MCPVVSGDRVVSPYEYFSEREFNSLTPSCSSSDMDVEFMTRLEIARSIAGIPFVLNSAYRSPAWDVARGRSGCGLHTKGRAVDIRCVSSEQRYTIVRSLIDAGFNGIGLYKNFIHVDDRGRDVESYVPLMFFGDLLKLKE